MHILLIALICLIWGFMYMMDEFWGMRKMNAMGDTLASILDTPSRWRSVLYVNLVASCARPLKPARSIIVVQSNPRFSLLPNLRPVQYGPYPRLFKRQNAIKVIWNYLLNCPSAWLLKFSNPWSMHLRWARCPVKSLQCRHEHFDSVWFTCAIAISSCISLSRKSRFRWIV